MPVIDLTPSATEMTGQLATPISRLGLIQLGAVSVSSGPVALGLIELEESIVLVGG